MSARGAEHGYTYTGDASTYAVTMLRRDTRRGTAHIRIDAVIDGVSITLPLGARVTVPLRRVTVN